MTKAEFSKQAMAQYKATIEKVVKGTDWVSEMNFIYSPSSIFRVWYDHKAENGKGLFMHRWCSVQKIESHDAEHKILRQAGQILSADTDKEIKVMVDILRKALTVDPKQTIDYIDGIKTWHNVEYSFTVKSACEYIGIEV